MNNYLFILTIWAGGGIENVFENIVRCLKQLNSNSNIYLFIVKRVNLNEYRIPNNVILIDSFFKLFDLKYKLKFNKVVNFSGDWVSSIVSRFINKKYISWIHCNPYTMKQAKTSTINFYLLKKSILCVCVCQEQKEILINEYGFLKNKIKVIYNPIDKKDIEEKIKTTCPINTESYILMVARIDMNSKDFYSLVEAYSMLDKHLRETYKLVFVGDGPDRKKLEKYVIEKKLTDRVLVWGYDKNPYRWLKNASCFVLSSKTEGFAIAVVEAMTIGCPVVLTNYHTGSLELSDSGKNAIIVEISDVKSMALSITKILTNKELAIRLVANSIEFSKKFSLTNFMIGLKEIIKL